MAEKSNAAFAESLRAYLVTRRAEQFSFLSKIVRVNSENPPGDIAAAVDRIERVLEELEFDVRRLPVDPEAAERAGRPPYDNLSVDVSFGARPGAGPHIMLATHADTMPAGPGWTREPQGAAIDEGRMFGRGVADGKGDLAAYAFVLAALRDCGAGLVGRVTLQVTFDGASGGALGFRQLLSVTGDRPDMAVVAGVADGVGTTATGVLDLDVDVIGQAAPAGVPQGGADALEATAAILAAIYKYRDGLKAKRSSVSGIGSPTLVVTEVRGGDGALAVPDRVRLLVDRRLLPEEDADAVQAELTNLIGKAVVSVPGVVCKVRRRRLLPAVVPDAAAQPLIDALRDGVEAAGAARPAVYGTAYETPARDFAQADVPVAMYGAGSVDSAGAMAVRSDESLELDMLRLATESLALALSNLLRMKPAPDGSDAA